MVLSLLPSEGRHSIDIVEEDLRGQREPSRAGLFEVSSDVRHAAGFCDGPYTAGAHMRLQAEVHEWLM